MDVQGDVLQAHTVDGQNSARMRLRATVKDVKAVKVHSEIPNASTSGDAMSSEVPAALAGLSTYVERAAELRQRHPHASQMATSRARSQPAASTVCFSRCHGDETGNGVGVHRVVVALV